MIPHQWPTGCLVYDEDEQGNPVNPRNVKVVPLGFAKVLHAAIDGDEYQRAQAKELFHKLTREPR